MSTENKELKSKLEALERELEKSKERIEELESKQQQKGITQSQAEHTQAWGSSEGWGHSEGWGNQDKSKEIEKEW